MPSCELCGVDESDLTKIIVSHAELSVCSNCVHLGTPLNGEDESIENEEQDSKKEEETKTEFNSSFESNFTDPSKSLASPPKQPQPNIISSLVPDYPKRIRKGREQSGLSIEELADKMNEKASYLRNVERGETKPNTTLQMQLEQFLEINLTPDFKNKDWNNKK